MDFSAITVNSKKVSRVFRRGYFDKRNYTKKVRGSKVDFLTIKIISKKVYGNNVNFWTIEITLKKDVETTWIIQLSNYIEKSTRRERGFSDRQNHVEKSTWKQRGIFDQ